MKAYTIMFIVLSSFAIEGCYSLYNFQSARTLEPGEIELGLAYNHGIVFQETNIATDSSSDLITPWPSIDLIAFGRYGLLKKMDIGLNLSSIFDFGADLKYQFLGDSDSRFALSTDYMFRTKLNNVELDNYRSMGFYVYGSFKPLDRMEIFLAPFYSFDYRQSIDKTRFSSQRSGLVGGLLFKFKSSELIVSMNSSHALGVDKLNYLFFDSYPIDYYSFTVGWSYIFRNKD